MSNIDFAKVVSAEAAKALKQRRMLSLLAELRSEHARAGYLLPTGERIQTDRKSRTELGIQWLLHKAGNRDAPLHWKCHEGWIVMSPDMLGQVIWKIYDHVEACFQAEHAVTDRINSGELTEFSEAAELFKNMLEYFTEE